MINPRIILLGAGGSAMSAVTRMLHQLGYTHLIAIDAAQSQLTDQLIAEGITVQIGHGGLQIQTGDVIIASAAAVGSDERDQAMKLWYDDHVKAIKPLLMHEFLGEMSKSMKTIAITGTHGKSSTTALAGKVFAELDPQFGLCVLGAGLADRGGANYKLNETHTSDIRRLTDRIFSRKALGIEDIWKHYTFLIEADEYNRHMLYYDPDTTVITTLSHDHVDIYPTADDYYEAFRSFVLKTAHTTYGIDTDQGVLRLQGALTDEQSKKLHLLQTKQFEFDHLVGGHNHANATLIHQLALDWGLDDDAVAASLRSFKSLRRRAETIGVNTQGCTIISDYAHHPHEVASTYTALMDTYPDQLLHIIFQPHQAQRLLEFWDQAVQTLQQFNSPVIYQIYAAREDVPALLRQYVLSDADITTAQELGEHFAHQAGATYIDDEAQIIEHIDSIDSGIIILFTAGNLDYLVRNSLV